MNKKHKEKWYLLGVDTGSSKTHAILSDHSGQVVAFGESGCGNYEVVGEKGFQDSLQTATNQAIKTANIDRQKITALGLGISGFDWPSEEPIMIEAIKSLQINCPFQFVNDVTLGLIAGSSEGWGIAVDAGTGNNVRGRSKSGKIGRITGNGMHFGEFGGASELVWLGMVAVIHAWSSRGPKTQLTQLFMDYARVDSEDALIENLATDKINLLPDLAKDIIKLAKAGDRQAKQAVQFNAKELARNVNAVIRQLNFETIDFEIIMIGSLFNAGKIFNKPFKETILKYAPDAKFLHLSVPPVTGAILIAAELAGIKTDQFRYTLLQSLQEKFS